MSSSSLVAEVDALRTDMAACLRALSGGTDAQESYDALVANFVERANGIRRTFAIAALRHDVARDDASMDANVLQREVAALRKELIEKEALLATHRENLTRWQAECQAVQTASEALQDIPAEASQGSVQSTERQ